MGLFGLVMLWADLSDGTRRNERGGWWSVHWTVAKNVGVFAGDMVGGYVVIWFDLISDTSFDASNTI